MYEVYDENGKLIKTVNDLTMAYGLLWWRVYADVVYLDENPDRNSWTLKYRIGGEIYQTKFTVKKVGNNEL